MVRSFFARHRHVAVLIAVVLLLTTVPVVETAFVVGDAWQGIIPPYSDDLNYARVQTIAEGHLSAGNAYYLEHSDGAPLVIFAGAWLNALPMLLGLPYLVGIMFNFVLWSLLFAAVVYVLLRELRLAPWASVLGTLFLYVQSYEHVWRPINAQTVYPFYFLFYVALWRLIREQSRTNIALASVAFGATFYFYSYLWQTAFITLGVLFLYALVRRNWPLLRASFISGFWGCVIGLPIPLYAVWLSNASPYFWESVGRLGLVNTHLPMAEVIYSGGWIGVMCFFIAMLWWRVPTLREDKEFVQLGSFIAISGFGLWIMEGSNLITGKLLETGEHMVGLIMPWIVFSAISIGAYLWSHRAQLSPAVRLFSVGMLVLFSIVSVRYVSLDAFLPPHIERGRLQAQQDYAKPFEWLQREEQEPVVVWSDPDHYATVLLPIYTRHFTLDVFWGMLELLPEGEVRERYLISQYFDNPSLADLQTVDEMSLYLGRSDLPHRANTITRGIKICRILFFWDSQKECGTPPTPQQLLGEQFFIDLDKKFQTDIKPNIKAYLKKYNVSYILKDIELNPRYRPEVLGAVQVYRDDRFELYKMQY